MTSDSYSKFVINFNKFYFIVLSFNKYYSY